MTFLDTDHLSLDYLIAECIWDSSSKEDDDGETLNSQLQRHFYSKAIDRGDFTLRY